MQLISTYSSRFATTYCSSVYNSWQGDVCDRIVWKGKARKHDCSMVIVPITTAQLATIAPKKVTTDQWKAYWGVNQVERLQRTLESLLVAYGGAWAAWFLSFMMGKFVSTFLGCGLIFNWMFTPYVVSSTSNKSLWYKDGKLLHHALFKGTITSLKKIRRRSGKNIGTVSQTYLDLLVVDELNREMEIITGWKGMSLETMLASTTNAYTTITATSDAYIPALNTWVGEYPYLDKKEYVRLRRSVWERVGDANADLEDEDAGFGAGSRPRGDSSKASTTGKDRRKKPIVIDAEEVDEESEDIFYPNSQWRQNDSEEF